MNMACSSVFRGGGTNQELVLQCLHECGGNFLVSDVSVCRNVFVAVHLSDITLSSLCTHKCFVVEALLTAVLI